MRSGNIDKAILLIGMVAAGYYSFERKGDALPASRIPVSWAATSVLGAIFLAGLLLIPWLWISVGTMGMAACYLTQRTGSLKTSIIFHAVGNLLISLDVFMFFQLPLCLALRMARIGNYFPISSHR
jgi:membrane protease YdiL (CAAX protease family)